MKTYLVYFFLVIFSATSLLAQNRPPAEVDNTIRATVQLMMGPDDADFSDFIQRNFSKKGKFSGSIQELENNLKKIKQATHGAGGVDIAVSNEVFRIIFSEGASATLVLIFDPDEPGKIKLLDLANTDPSKMSDQEKFENAMRMRVQRMESLATLEMESEFVEFIKENFSPGFISTTDRNGLIQDLKSVGLAAATSSVINVKPGSSQNEAVLVLKGSKSAEVSFSIEDVDPYRIDRFVVNTNVSALDDDNTNALIALNWKTYKDVLLEEASKGFSGAVLIVRNGKVVHQQGYGFANKSNVLKNSSKIIFDVGSVPIDFTRAAILKLVDDGKISFDDPIDKFIDNVPADKKRMTIEHLMTNKSGLHNFHGDDSKDVDHDLSWISREEAINRMLSRKLLFEPGSDVSPSHSGYGLLAAIVEIVSGKTYEAFLKDVFFTPLKMKNTGPYGESATLNPRMMAVGYGKQVSDPNIPAKWGPTSWLIKGSGGMVSSPSDLYLWNKGLHDGKILSEKSKEFYSKGKFSVGGSERGFFTVYTRSPDNAVVICSNADRSEYPDVMRLFRSLENLYK